MNRQSSRTASELLAAMVKKTPSGVVVYLRKAASLKTGNNTEGFFNFT
jgi:hypothetical protein